ncbi:UDP-3-O-acyl-N-acetylglucosamine deacetylase, partial [Mesorhizobium sp. M2D.F.Ca.ET.145.01.1.1]
GIVLHDHQTTVKTRASLTGTGVHSGKEVSISFLPADADTGIVFQLLNGDGQGREFRALFSEIGATDLCTMLGDPSGEHIGSSRSLVTPMRSRKS